MAVARLVVVGISECEGGLEKSVKAFQTKGIAQQRQRLKTAGCVSVGKN